MPASSGGGGAVASRRKRAGMRGEGGHTGGSGFRSSRRMIPSPCRVRSCTETTRSTGCGRDGRPQPLTVGRRIVCAGRLVVRLLLGRVSRGRRGGGAAWRGVLSATHRIGRGFGRCSAMGVSLSFGLSGGARPIDVGSMTRPTQGVIGRGSEGAEGSKEQGNKGTRDRGGRRFPLSIGEHASGRSLTVAVRIS